MTVSKKHYEAVAKAIRGLRDAAITDLLEDAERWERLACGQDTEEAEQSGALAGVVEGIEITAAQLAVVLADDNPRFDRKRFLTACGIIEERAEMLAEVSA